MVRVKPFQAIHPKPNLASLVASVPYDVVTRSEARALAQGNHHSFLHVIRPEIDLPDDVDLHDDCVYEKARSNLEQLLNDGVLIQDAEPDLFIYRQVQGNHIQTGVVCCCHIDDYRNNIIKKHERTRPDKEDDRTRHTITLRANAGPVFLTYRDTPSIDQLVDHDVNQRPLFHFNAPDGVTHTVWRVSDASAYVTAFEQIPSAYVADGHHRAASAARAGTELRQNRAGGVQECDWFLTVLFPASQLQILAYNRVVVGLNHQRPEVLLEAISQLGQVHPTEKPHPAEHGLICFYLKGQWYELRFNPESIDTNNPIKSLDVALLQDRILEPLLDIEDPRTDQRIKFVGGHQATETMAKMIDQDQGSIAFSLYPTSIDQLLAVSDADLMMPPKSTWFEPKLRSGLFVHALDDELST